MSIVAKGKSKVKGRKKFGENDDDIKKFIKNLINFQKEVLE